ncbi:MAG: site-specific integrase, partial [Nocardioidaceae bacterium]
MTRSRKPNRRSSIYYSETDGYWHGWVYMGVKDDGSPDRRHRKAKTETVVTAKVQKLEDERSAGTVAKVGERLTVEAWMQTWLTQIAPRRVARSTLTSTYEPKVRRWIIPRLGRHYLDRLEPHHLDTFYMWLAEQDLKPNTILQIHRILARALKVAYQREKIKRNVTALVEAPTGEYTEIEPFALDDAQAILVAA